MHETTASTPQLRDFAGYAKPGTELGGIARVVFRLLAYILLIIGALIALFLLLLIGELRTIVATWGALGGFLFGVFLFIFYRQAASALTYRRSPFYKVFMSASLIFKGIGQRFGVDYIAMLQEDTRSPILFLRGFRSDSSFSFSHSDFQSDEQVLISIFQDSGPVIAAGRVNEVLPLSGAIRLYFEDHEWQEKISALISISKLIIIQPDPSRSMEWELSTVMAMKKSHPSHLLFSFLGWQRLGKAARMERYSRFRLTLERISGIKLPRWADGAYFLFFTSRWEAFLTSPSQTRGHLKWKNTRDPRVLSALLPFFNSSDQSSCGAEGSVPPALP
jgi:hypothetical protein